MTRFAMLASSALLVSCLDAVSAQPLQALGGEPGGRNVRITIDITDVPAHPAAVTNPPPAVSVAPVAQTEPAVLAGAVAQAAEEPPPLPSAEDSATPKALVAYFCRMWRDENYEAMYYCMSKSYRMQVGGEKFGALFTSDAEKTGGLDSAVIVAEEPENAAGPLLLLDLKFMKMKVPPRRVKAVFEKTKDGYRLVKSGILPVDFSNL